MVGLFSPSASTLMTRLAPDNNRALFQQYYSAFLGLAKWAKHPAYDRVRTDVQRR